MASDGKIAILWIEQILHRSQECGFHRQIGLILFWTKETENVYHPKLTDMGVVVLVDLVDAVSRL